MRSMLRMALEAATSNVNLGELHYETASPASLSAIVEFYKTFDPGYESTMWVLDKDKEAGNLEWHKKQSDTLYLLAIDRRKKVAGILECMHYNFPWNPDGQRLFIDALGVDPEYRGVGLGRILLHKAVDHARALKAKYLELVVEQHNESAIAWYERQGFKYVPDKHTEKKLKGFLYQLYV